MYQKKIYAQLFKTSVGELKIASFNDRIVLCDWHYRKMRQTIDKRIEKYLQAAVWQEKETQIIELCKKQITEYLEEKRQKFTVPIEFIGTDFQQKVWKELMNIPFGKTLTYQKLSEHMNQPKAIRAIAAANGANGISIIVPCHRIIGSNGQLIGYAGGLSTKKKLLNMEKNNLQLELFV